MEGQASEDPRLGVGVREDAPGRRIHEEQLAGRQAAGPHDLAGRERHRARLGGHRDHPVGGQRPGRRPEPVAVEQRADPAAVAEHERAGAVPRRDEPGHAPAERGDRRVRGAAEGGGLGDEREQGALERPAGRDQQLQRLVEGPRVADAGGEQGTGGAEPVGGLATAARDARVVAAAADGLAVPADGVDLAVVRDERERLGERPDGRRVGRVPLVEHRERDVDRRAEVREQLGEPSAGDQALVDDGPRRGGHDGERVHAQRTGTRVGPAAGTGERELEVGLGERGRAGDQRLLDDRQGCRGLAAERGGIERDASPDGRGQAFLGQRGLDDRPRPGVGRGAAPSRRREHGQHARPIAGDGVRVEDADERRRQGQQDPGTVARRAVSREGAPVTQGAQTAEGEGEDACTRPAAGVRNEPDPAGIVLVARVVEGRLLAEPVPGLSLWGAVVGHRRLPIGRRTPGGRSWWVTARRAHRAVVGVRPGRRPRRGPRGRGRPPRLRA